MKTQSLLVLAMAFLGVLGVAQAGPVVAFNVAGPITLSNAGTATVGLVVSNLPQPLAAWDVSVLFAPATFTVNLPGAVSFGDPVNGDQLALNGAPTLPIANIFATSNLSIDALHLAEVSLGSASDLAAQLPTFTLATITFTGSPGAQQTLTLQVNTLAGASGTILNGVPEPATWLLGAAGLAALMLLRRRRAPNAT